jgi:lipooligosaccharide transport system ATP-binding protein
MTGPRLLGFIGAGAFAGGWLARAAFDWGLGLPLVLFLALVLAAAVAGGLVGYAAARDEAPLDSRLVAIAVPGGILGAASFFAPRSASPGRRSWSSRASGCSPAGPPGPEAFRCEPVPQYGAGSPPPRAAPRPSFWWVVSEPLAIRLRGVVKRYGPITAVAGLDLELPEGSCVGLLGPNGAGKSTTMKMLTAQAIADEGELEVLGHRLPEASKQARAECGVVPQLDNLDTTLTVEQNLVVFTHLYRLGRGERREAVERALEIAKLVDRRATKVDKLSGGMRRRLLIARALVHRPRMMLLDEPTVGLDPQVRQELWALIDGLRSEGVSILMSTHYIEEAERLCDSVTIMSHGRAVATGPPADLIAEHAGTEAVEVYGAPPKLAEVEAAARAVGLSTRRTGTSIAVLRLDSANGATPAGERRPANLEDVFVLLTGEDIG